MDEPCQTLNWLLPSLPPRYRTIVADTVAILILTAALVWPLFRLGYMENWSSIESTFIADARMLAAHLPHPGWQPLRYCGTRFDYVYPPALRYGTALISLMSGVSTARAYHLYTAFFYILGIAAVYWLARVGSASRATALLASAGTALLSPSFLFLKTFRVDSNFWVPQRLHVLAAYGEGPHISALCVLPAALAATLAALRRRSPLWTVAAGALCALVVASNFYGATALALFFPLLVWSVWAGERGTRVWPRAALIVAIACGLSAFWLTPTYLRITLLNLKWVAQPGNSLSVYVGVALVALFCAISFRLGNGRPQRSWTIFVFGAAALLTVNVAGLQLFGFRIVGEPHRLVPELDLALVFAFAETIRLLWPRPAWRIPLALLMILAFLPAGRYLTHAWTPFPPSRPLTDVYQYRIARWVNERLPGERVLASGSVRFWFDAWSDNAQVQGGSDQGMLNQMIPVATWQIYRGERADLAKQWLQALGTDAIIVPDATSAEPYHDFPHPEKFRGPFPVLFDDGQGTVIYGVPRTHPGIGRMVDASAIASAGQLETGDPDRLARYVAIVEDPRRAGAAVQWRGPDALEIRATAGGGGEAILLQETWDPAWHAWENGQELPVRREPAMGFMTIPVSAGNHAIAMRFETPAENRIGQALFFVTLAGCGLMLWRSRRSV